MNIAGIGTDVVEIERFKAACERQGKNFLKKIFTKKEMEYGKVKKAYFMHMAAKFAAKEAVKKALPDGIKIGMNWRDIEILNDKDGKPYIVLHGRARDLAKKTRISNIFVSISHTEKIAVSNALVGIK